MNKIISHYVARFDMPGWKKGARVPEGHDLHHLYPDVFEPVYKEDPVITRTPICQLPDENGKMIPLYVGDPYWWVDLNNWTIHELRISKYSDPGRSCVATLPAAKIYVLDNKPEIPWGLIDPILAWFDQNGGWNIGPAISSLKAFKETHLKDKV